MFGYAARVGELRVNVDDVQALAVAYQASARGLADDGPAAAGRSFQPTAAVVQAVHAGTATARAALSARAADTGIKVAEADARYAQNEAESAAKLHAASPQAL
jgi:hypothetical protein